MKTHSKKTLAIFHADWEQFPSKPISLLEIMRQFSAYNIYQWDSLLEKWMEETENFNQKTGKTLSQIAF
jgi:hypothetical protein